MQYPPPQTPSALSFSGSASFFTDAAPLGQSPVLLQCDVTGRIICWCLAPPLPLKFALLGDTEIRGEGTLVDGRPFNCSYLHPVSWPSEALPADAVALHSPHLIIGQEAPVHGWTFAVTNLLLQNFSTAERPAIVSIPQRNLRVTLTPVADYGVRMAHLRAYKGTDVTAMLSVHATSPANDFTVADDLCLIFSVLTGHKVNWVARQAGRTMIFEDRVTKPCSGWPVLGRLASALGRDWDWQDLLAAATDALPAFRDHAVPYRLRCGLVDAWIDARIETDFLETRGLKTVAVLEVIKSAYRDHTNVHGGFRDLLEGVHEYLGLPIPDTLPTIVEIRNRLVHEGRFLPAAEIPVVQQYELLACHTDRLVLAIAGYKGMTTSATGTTG